MFEILTSRLLTTSLVLNNRHLHFTVSSYIQEYCSGIHVFPVFIYLSTSVISTYWYLRVDFPGLENLEIPVVWDEL